MSCIIETQGAFTSEALAAALSGMVWMGSARHTSFYEERKLPTTRFGDSDTICIAGKMISRKSETPIADINPHRYRSPDFHVILDGPDRIFYKLKRWVLRLDPYPLLVAYMFGVTQAMASSYGIAVFCFEFFGYGWWSLLNACAVPIFVLLYFLLLHYRVRILIAGAIGAAYVRKQVRSGNGTREHYVQLVDHLRKCEERDISEVNAAVFRFI